MVWNRSLPGQRPEIMGREVIKFAHAG
jgi:hypothetical protein